jgi:hypothetical protein
MMNAMMMFKSAATIEVLEKGFKAASKGKHIRKDIGQINKGIGAFFPGGKMGPGTVPRKAAADFNVPKNLEGKVYIKGDSGKHLEGLGLKDSIKSQKNRGKERRGLNSSMNLHEIDELKEFNKHGRKGQTLAASGVGHHSYAKILGRESNRAVTAKGTSAKLGTKAMTRLRTKTGEKDVFDKLALKDKNGKTPFKYGRDRMNRSYIKAMYKKEKNMGLQELEKLFS